MANEYDDLIDTSSDSNALKQSFFAAQDSQPETFAKSLDISSKINVPAQFVEQNFETFSKEDPIDYDSLIESNPKLSEYLSNIDNAKISKDDVENLKPIENEFKTFKQMGELVKAMGSGALSMASGSIKSLSMLPDISEAITGDTFKQRGSPIVKFQQDTLMRNPVTLELDKTSSELKPKVDQGDILLSLSKGEYFPLAVSIAENLPQLAITAINPAAGLSIMTAGSAGQKLESNLEAGVDRKTAVANALLTSGVESAIEMTGGIGANPLKNTIKQAIQNVGEAGVKSSLMKSLKVIFTEGVKQEGGEEFVTEVAQSMIDWSMGVDDQALDNVLNRALNAAVVGGASGGLVTSVGVAGVEGSRLFTKDIEEFNKRFVVNQSGEFYKNIGEQIQKSKTFERSSDKTAEFINGQVKDTGVENVNVEVEKFDEYFQSKKIDPTQAAKDFGFEKEYAKAKETGADLTVDTGKWVSKLAKTEHYAALQDDIKFRADMPSKNDLKKEDEEIKKVVKEMNDFVAESKKEEINFDKETAAVLNDYKAQIIESGYTKEEAEQLKHVFRVIPALASKMGISPKELADKVGLKIIKGIDRNVPPVIPEFEPVREELEFSRLMARDDNGQIVHDKEVLQFINSGVSRGSAGSRIMTPRGVVSNPSTYPEWFKDKRLKGKEVLNVVNKKLNGEILTEAQSRLLDEVYELAANAWVRNELFQQQSGKPQGSFSKLGNERIIKIFKQKDQSTLLHEASHAFLDVINDLGQQNDRVKKDLDQILKWFGVADYSEVTRDHHEKFARGFETYLLEGKSPVSALRKAFNTFKQWLKFLYHDAFGIQRQLENQIGRPLNKDEKLIDDDLRKFFDAMFMTEREIELAEQEMGVVDLAIDDPAFKEAVEEATIAAEAKLTKQKMSELEIKKSKEYRKLYDELREQFANEMSSQPIYNAIAVLRTGKLLNGENHPLGEFKIDINSIPQDRRKDVPRGTTSKTGVDYKYAADQLGYEGDYAKFLEDYLSVLNIDEAARIKADEYIKLKYPDLRRPVNENDPAIEAFHNDKRALKLKYEYEYLFNKARGEFNKMARRVIAREPIDKVVKEQAKKFVSRLSVEEMKAYQYLRAERKSSRDAAAAFTRGDWEAALKAKRQELYNHEIVKFIHEANRDVEKSLRKFQKLFKKKDDLAKSRDMDFVNAGLFILEKYGISKKKMAGQPLEYLSKIKEYAPDTYNALGEMIVETINGADNYKKVSYDKFVEMRDTVDTLWDMAKSEQETKLSDRKVENATIIKEISEQIAKHNPKKNNPKVALTDAEKRSNQISSFKASLKRTEHWADYMDFGNISGPFKKYIFQPISEAATRYRLGKAEVLKKYVSILDKNKDLFKKQISVQAPELGEGIVFDNKGQLIMMILHSGNESNKSKLVRGRGWGNLNEDGSLNSTNFDAFMTRLQQEGVLTKQHYDLAQEIWDLMESVKPQAQKAHKEMYGFYFNEITANPVQTLFGEYKGGYIPAKVDPDLSVDSEQRKIAEMLEGNNSTMFPTTGRGFTKSRVESYAAPLDLNLNMLGGHIDSTMRFIHLEPVVKDIARLLKNREMAAVIGSVDKYAISEMLIPWLQRAASQKTTEWSKDGWGRAVDQMAKYLTKTVSMQVMTGNVINAAQQFTGIIVAATEVNETNLAHATSEYATNRDKVLKNMLDKSDFMKTQMESNLYELNNAIEEIVTNKSTFENAKDFASRHTYFLQSATQNIVNTIVWTGAYNQMVARGETDTQAIKFADSAVRKTQGTMNAEDVARVMVGTPVKQMFMQFAGYFNLILNQQASKLGTINKTTGFKKGFGKAMYMHMAGFAIPAVLSGIMSAVLAGKVGDDDEDSTLFELLKVSGDSYIKSYFPMIPIVGNIATAAYNRISTEAVYDDRVQVSPVISFVEQGLGGVDIPYKIATGKEIKKSDVKDALTLIGLVSGLPTGLIGRPVGYVMDVNKGKAKPEGPIDYTRGLITGQSGAKK